MKRTQQVAGLATILMTLLTTTTAQAFGGRHGSGERIVSSQVVSDTVVSTSDSGQSGGCANGDCGGGGGGIGGGGIGGGEAGFNSRTVYGQPDLFYNYYTQGDANVANAQMYIAPVPVPPNVGHTFYTYQPFYPEEFLYWHQNKFHNYYDNGRGLNRTRATYYSPPVHQAASNFYWNVLRIPR